MDVIYDFFEKGGPIMWPLLACSLISVTISIERAIFWFRERSGDNDESIRVALDMFEKGDYAATVSELEKRDNYFARVLAQGVKQRDHGLVEVVQMAAGREIERMKAGMSVLDTIITMAPLLGILGTVIGIIASFNLLGMAGIEDPKAVTAGIAQALITTAAGLSVALVSLIPFNYFVSRVQKAGKDLEIVATEFEIVFRRSRIVR